MSDDNEDYSNGDARATMGEKDRGKSREKKFESDGVFYFVSLGVIYSCLFVLNLLISRAFALR